MVYGQPKPPLDASAIERIQRWSHCCRVLENFMKTIVEPAWRGLEKTDYIQKWRMLVHYSKDPVNHTKEKLLNPIDAFEYWAGQMWKIRPGMVQMLYDQLEYTSDLPHVPSTPHSKMTDWTFAVHVLRWMVIHDPMVSESLRDAYKTEKLSVGLIDDIEWMYSDMEHDANEFLREGGLKSLLVQLKQLCF